MLKLLVIHLVTDLRQEAGGIATVVPALAHALRERGIDSRFVTCAHDPDFAWRTRTVVVPAGQTRSRAALTEVIRKAVADRPQAAQVVLHSHGLWHMLNHAGVRFARETGFGSLVSLHGMLLPWARSHRKLRKDLAWLLYQRRDLLQADGVHVTSQAEADILSGVVARERLHAIHFGVAVPEAVLPPSHETSGRTLLFLGRLHPVKNLEGLIRAFVQAAPAGYRLRLVGPEEGNHRSTLAALVNELRAGDRVEMPGPAYGAAKMTEIAAAHVVLLPSFSENFGAVVAEALAMGRPVIASTGTPWQAIQSERCGWWVAPDVESLAKAIRTVAATPDAQLSAMGMRGRALVTREFGWPHIADRMTALYASIASSQDIARCEPCP